MLLGWVSEAQLLLSWGRSSFLELWNNKLACLIPLERPGEEGDASMMPQKSILCNPALLLSPTPPPALSPYSPLIPLSNQPSCLRIYKHTKFIPVSVRAYCWASYLKSLLLLSPSHAFRRAVPAQSQAPLMVALLHHLWHLVCISPSRVILPTLAYWFFIGSCL